MNGKPIRTIGMVNFLDDPTQTPHLKLSEIDRALGVSTGTAQGKSKMIREMFGIQQLDKNWTLPSLIGDNPMVWLLEVNGFVMDVRTLPREVQQIAFEDGLIPYIPADREQVPPPDLEVPSVAQQQTAVPPVPHKRKSITPDSAQRALFD